MSYPWLATTYIRGEDKTYHLNDEVLILSSSSLKEFGCLRQSSPYRRVLFLMSAQSSPSLRKWNPNSMMTHLRLLLPPRPIAHFLMCSPSNRASLHTLPNNPLTEGWLEHCTSIIPRDLESGGFSSPRPLIKSCASIIRQTKPRLTSSSRKSS